jgi:hypothetical protein
VSSYPTTTPNRSLFRGTVLMFAFVLGCQATWILAAEIFRPALPGFPANPQAAAAAAANRDEATLASSFGFIRGDLWAERALTYLDMFWSDDRDSASAQVPKTIEHAREAADRALAFAPHDARIWLILASIDSRFDWLNHNMAADLRMSYYTGTNETDLIPLRLLLAVRSDALADRDFQQLVRHDVSIIVTRKPDLTPAILTAYRDALPIGQQFLEETLAEIDPALLTRLRSKG